MKLPKARMNTICEFSTKTTEEELIEIRHMLRDVLLSPKNDLKFFL